MTTLIADTRQRSLLDPLEEGPRRSPRRAAEVRRPEPRAATLADLVAGAWSSLVVTHASACLLCGGEVVPRYGSGPHPVGGACRHCGTEIA